MIWIVEEIDWKHNNIHSLQVSHLRLPVSQEILSLGNFVAATKFPRKFCRPPTKFPRKFGRT